MTAPSGEGPNEAAEMVLHPQVSRVVAQFAAKELHAARSGRDVMRALVAVVIDSPARSLETVGQELESNMDALVQVMPTYAPPINVMHDVHSSFERARRSHQPLDAFRTSMAQADDSYQQWSERARTTIAESAMHVIPKHGVVFTFTLSETVLTVLRRTRARGVPFTVLVTESRPNGDGRMTARAMSDHDLDVAIGVDGSMGELIPRADVMLVGAEAILSDGSAVCKVGTYPSALVAKRSGVPVYVLVDSRKFHPVSLLGHQPWLDRIERGDVFSEDASPRADVSGHLFDRTPAELITALITERGSLHPQQVSQWMLEMPLSDFVVNRLRDRAMNQGTGAS